MTSTEKRINSSCGAKAKAKASLIPVDVWFEILTLLPIKTLLVLRAVCKSFLSITNDPNFISIHLRRRPNNHRETRILTLRPSLNSYQVYETSTNNNDSALPLYSNYTSHSPMRTIRGQITLDSTDKNWTLAGSLNGLLLLLSTPKLDIKGPRIAVLWNPSVRKHRQLAFPARAKLRHAGLGYHNNDYKVVAMACTDNLAWVYSVKAGSWTKIPNSGFRKRSTYRSGYSQSLSYKDGVVWMERHDLVWFDFGTEKFRYIEMTPLLNDDVPIPFPFRGDCYAGLVILDGGSSVGVWKTTSTPAGVEPSEAGVWALETETLSWGRRYTPKLLPMALRGGQRPYVVSLEQWDGELVFKYLYSQWSEGKYFRVFTYDHESHETLSIKLVHDCLELTGDYMGAYIESLIMP